MVRRRSVLAVLFGLSACARIAPGQGQDLRSAPANDAQIAVLNYNLDAASSLHMADCLTSALRKQEKQLRIMPAQQAKNAFFPWLEESVLSLEPKQVAMLLSDQLIQVRSRESGLRYLVILTEARSSSQMRGPFVCGGGYGGAGCLGGARIGRETTIGVIVWDLERGRESQELSVTEHAHDLIVGALLPVWIPGGLSTKMQACHTMAQRVLQIVRDSADARNATVWWSSAELTDTANKPDSGSEPP